MGGRGGSSHRSTASARGGRAMMDWSGEQNAKNWLMRDLGYSVAQANRMYDLMRDYYGSGYDAYTGTNQFAEKTELSNVLNLLPYYNGSTLYRGMVMDDREADRLYVNRWSPGSTQNLGGRIQSFSDKRSVSESFGNWSYVGRGNTSVMLILEGNKTIPGVAHLSFQRGEREALAPLNLEFEVVRSEVTYSSNGGRRIVYYLKDKKK